MSICGYRGPRDAFTFGDAAARRLAKKIALGSLSRLFTGAHTKISAQNYWACSCYEMVPGDTAENLGRVLLSMRAGGFTISLSEPSHKALHFLGGLKKQSARTKSAEPFEVFSAASCSAAAVPPRRFEHHVINILRV